MKKLFLTLFIALLPLAAHAQGKPLPRVLVALYDSRVEPSPRVTTVQNYLGLPANHLGYDINFYDVNAPLPALGDNVAGVVLWFNTGLEVPDVHAYVDWLSGVIRQNKKIIMIENPGLDISHIKEPKILAEWNDILGYVGVQDDTNWTQLTYDAEISSIDRNMVGFERQIKQPFPEISGIRTLAGSHSISHLRMHVGGMNNDENFDMVITGPHGGLIAPGYAIFEEFKMVKAHVKTERDKEERVVDKEHITQEWIVNPFTFLSQALNDGLHPVPDTTTLDGRRIFYAHIDGDGWNNISEIERYRANNNISADVIYREILKPYTDFAFSVGLISEDVDPQCFAIPDSEKVAREIFALPNIEPSSHTYSHPIYWGFFANYTPDKEKPLLRYYPPKPEEKFSAVEMLKRKMFGASTSWGDKASEPARENAGEEKPKKADNLGARRRKTKSEEEILKEIDYMPRSYSCTPFRLEDEIVKSIDIVKKLSPPNKTVRLIQWPGDTSPFEAALALTRKSGFLNINGGDSRFDGEFPSYSFVAPIGIKIGNERQIFSSNSNEETYTDDWTDRFYGYVYLKSTVLKTDKPVRVSPFNVYFHMFSGEKEAALGAVKDNLNFARTQDIIPVTASDYASIAEGFYSSEIIPEGENAWAIRNRGDLGTVRFDNAEHLSVSIAGSRGVLGQHYLNGSLYVALDPAVKDAYVKITPGQSERGPLQLVQSRWRVSDLHRDENSGQFSASGYGSSDMVWQAMPGEHYVISTDDHGKWSSRYATADRKGIFTVSVKSDAIDRPVQFNIHPVARTAEAGAEKATEESENAPREAENAMENGMLKEVGIKSVEEAVKPNAEPAQPADEPARSK